MAKTGGSFVQISISNVKMLDRVWGSMRLPARTNSQVMALLQSQSEDDDFEFGAAAVVHVLAGLKDKAESELDELRSCKRR